MKILSTLATATAILTPQITAFQSLPFGLLVISENSTINGTLLGACHQGAAINGLCVTSEIAALPQSNYTTFYHNITDSSVNSSIPDTSGPLVYKWTANSGTLKVESTVALVYASGSNVALPIFFPGTTSSTYVSFDSCKELYISRNLDDTAVPPKFFDAPAKDFNWYICTTYYGYVYQTLAWRVGVTGEPQNPSCQKVKIKAVFLSTAP